jgi:hypothetical protein
MRRAILIPAILILAILIALVFFAQSRSTINVGGRDGNTLLGELTNNSANNSSNLAASGNKTINLSHSAASMKIGGNDGMLLEDLTNKSINMTDGRNASNNLTDWGSEPRPVPLPPKYDYQAAQMNAVIRMNHLGY